MGVKGRAGGGGVGCGGGVNADAEAAESQAAVESSNAASYSSGNGTASAPEGSLASDEALQALARRLANFHEITLVQDKVSDLVDLIRPLQLQALNDELDLLLQSGELSEAAERRKLGEKAKGFELNGTDTGIASGEHSCNDGDASKVIPLLGRLLGIG